jgi:hypothetical protein
MMKEDFPKIWVHRMVQARTRIMNQLQAVVLNEGLRCKSIPSF